MHTIAYRMRKAAKLIHAGSFAGDTGKGYRSNADGIIIGGGREIVDINKKPTRSNSDIGPEQAQTLSQRMLTESSETLVEILKLVTT